MNVVGEHGSGGAIDSRTSYIGNEIVWGARCDLGKNDPLVLVSQVHPQLSDALPRHRGLPGQLHPGGHRQIRAHHQLVKHEDAFSDLQHFSIPVLNVISDN